MASLTIENYLKTIFAICQSESGQFASTGAIAEALSVSPGTVTSMMKTLSESGLAIYKPYEGVELTNQGQKLALRILRRHRLIEVFLAQTLDLTWDEVHDEAENMEHAVSDFLVDRIDEFLGYPKTDPHGDPIPSADGTMDSSNDVSLLEIDSQSRFRLTRVTDQSAGFLKYLTENGLSLGVEGHVSANCQESNTISVVVNNRETTMSHESANHLGVEKIQ